MKKILASISFIALIAAFYTFQSCTKETTDNNVDKTTDLLIQDKDFQDFSVLHNDFTAQWKFLQVSCTGQQRQEYLDLIKHASNNTNGTLNNEKAVLSILGFADLNQGNAFIATYKRAYEIVKNKPYYGKNTSDKDVRAAIFKAFSQYSKTLRWKLKQDKQGLVRAIDKTEVSLKNLNTVQLRSCNCEVRGCELTYLFNLMHADMQLNYIIDTSGNDWALIAGGIADYMENASIAFEARCACIKAQNETCQCY